MYNRIKQSLTLLTGGLLLWLFWGFWSPGRDVALFLSAFVIIIAAVLIYRQQKQLRKEILTRADSLPADDYHGAVVLVCGQSAALFAAGENRRETTKARYIAVPEPAGLSRIIREFREQSPAQLNRLSILYVVVPEQINQEEELEQMIISWRRAVGEARRQAGKAVPFWISVYLTPLYTTDVSTADEEPWFTPAERAGEFHVQQAGSPACSLPEWLAHQPVTDEQRFATALWFDHYLAWLSLVFVPRLTVKQTGAAPLYPAGWALRFAPVAALNNNVWSQFIAHSTRLPLPVQTVTPQPLPMPDHLLSRLRYDVSLVRTEAVLGVTGIICGLFLAGALTGSYFHNQQLIYHISDDLRQFEQLPGEPAEPKMVAWKQLQTDAALLAAWQREGTPSSYSLGLYQGTRILPYLYTALSRWAPPPPPAPVIVQEAPEMVSLDSLALFDTGKFTLKPGATKVLVDALINIRAKPGWLIVVSGYTDITGHADFNQKLSLKRAESVRDWMIETSDIDPGCFAVQGYGHNHPVADNNTAEGRAKNRRVEIRLMPQADACRASDTENVSPADGDTHSPKKEK
ncbi:MAG TPA: hypothetical protein DIT05_00190 [Morganella sp. (in: Bacteria)]|nr:hypothetical protein [Morganella sp. (in: enterobacteria)]